MTRDMMSFDKAPVLRELFDSAEVLATQRNDETKALSSADQILVWVREKVTELAGQAGGQALRWVSSHLLRAVGLGGGAGELEEIRQSLRRIEDTQQEILRQLDTLLKEIQFQHLITRGFEAVERILSRQRRLTRLVDVPEEERPQEAQLLKAAILDPNSGVSVDLQIIHDVLIGNTRLDPDSQGILDLFMTKWRGLYISRSWWADYPLSLFEGRSYDYLRGLFLVQYMGLDQLANGRVANAQYSILKKELEQSADNLEQQRQKVEAFIPAWTRTWFRTVTDGTWYIIKPLDRRGKGREQVLYGSPAGGAGYHGLDYSVQFRDRHPRNGDEEWQFVPTGLTDTFRLVQRSRPHFVSATPKGNELIALKMEPSGANNVHFRFLMSYGGKPVLAAVNANMRHCPFLYWDSAGNNTCYLEPNLSGAVEIDVIRQ